MDNVDSVIDVCGEDIPGDDMKLLEKLQQQNRILESDTKSVKSVNGSLGSRRGSSSSLYSQTSCSSYLEDSDWDAWSKVISNWDETFKKKYKYVKGLVKRGIPQPFRAIVWQNLCNVNRCNLREKYREYIEQQSPSERTIRRDIARTYPDHDMFKEKDGPGQETLFNVMKAYSLHDREVGYCQGSAFIVGVLLMQMPEEEAFCVLVKIMQEFRMREIFKPSMAELGLCMYQFECLVQDQLPVLMNHFQAQSFHTSIYASSWFLTLFTVSMNRSASSRIIDLFLLDGLDIIFKVGFALLQLHQDVLLTLDLEFMLKFLKKSVSSKYESQAEINVLLDTADAVKLNTKKMKKLEKEYFTRKDKESEEMIEMRRLRTEIRLLHNKLEHFEKESNALADSLIEKQMEFAKHREEMDVMKNNYNKVKRQNDNVNGQLLEAMKENGALRDKMAIPKLGGKELIIEMQKEMLKVKLKEANAQCTITSLQGKIDELLKDRTQFGLNDSIVDDMQNELVAVKLREAEANSSFLELRSQLTNLDTFITTCKSDKFISKLVLGDLKQMHNELLAVRFNEAKLVAANLEFRQSMVMYQTKTQTLSCKLERSRLEKSHLEEINKEAMEKAKKLQVDVVEKNRVILKLESKLEELSICMRVQANEDLADIKALQREISKEVGRSTPADQASGTKSSCDASPMAGSSHPDDHQPPINGRPDSDWSLEAATDCPPDIFSELNSTLVSGQPGHSPSTPAGMNPEILITGVSSVGDSSQGDVLHF